MKDEQIDAVSKLLKSMSHPIRLKILCLLQDQELSVGEIRDSVKTTNANVSQHLNILRARELSISARMPTSFTTGSQTNASWNSSRRCMYCFARIIKVERSGLFVRQQKENSNGYTGLGSYSGGLVHTPQSLTRG